MFKPASVLVTLILLVAACAGPGATTKPSATAAAATPIAVATTAAPSPSPSAPAGATPSGAASPSPSPSPTAPPGAVAGTLTIWADTVRTPILKAVGADFTAKTQTPVQVYEIGFGDIRDRLATLGSHGAGPDIIIGAHDWLGKLVTAGVVEPLDLGTLSDKFLKVGLDAFTYGGKLYGMPYVSEAVALYYNTDLVPTAPTTWAELKAKAKELQDAGTVTQGYCLQNGDPYHTYPLLTGFGGYIFGKNADGSYNPSDVGLDTPGGLAYAAELDSMVKDGLLRNNIGYGDCTTMMTTGKAAFWITGPWALNDFNKAHAAGTVNFAVAPIPKMEETPRPFVGVQGFMVNSFAPNKLLAETFLKDYIATDDTMRTLWEADPRLPVWKQLADQMTDPNIIAFTTSASSGDPMPAIPQMDSVWKSWTDAINIVFGQTYNADAPDAATVFKDAAVQIRGLIGQ
jgi:arabinogalactan oligomer / maltooligosaccharide transport system substrate-binding protein